SLLLEFRRERRGILLASLLRTLHRPLAVSTVFEGVLGLTRRSSDPFCLLSTFLLTTAAPCSVGLLRQTFYQLKKLLRLADEKAHVGQEFHYAHGRTAGLGWANHRTDWELSAEKWTRLRHDQTGCKVFSAKRRSIQVNKGQAIGWIGDRRRIP